MKLARVNINLVFRFTDDTTDKEIKKLMENLELPEGYEEGSINVMHIDEVVSVKLGKSKKTYYVSPEHAKEFNN